MCKNSAAIFKMAKIRQSSKQDANKNLKPSYSMLKTMLNPTAVFVISTTSTVQSVMGLTGAVAL